MSTIFVFGSNLAGRHGAGSARHARLAYNAEYGVGEGRTGDAYAIPTKDAKLQVLPISEIEKSVTRFIEYAKTNPELRFEVVAIGCGLAAYHPCDIIPLFKGVPLNCDLPPGWRESLPEE